MAYGINPEGFTLKRLADIRADMVTALSQVEDPITGEKLIIDLSDENDPLVQIIDALSDSLSVNWEQLQTAYNQFDPLKATGAALSGLVQINGILRKAGTYSTVGLTLTGAPGLVVAAGKQVSDMNDTNIWFLPSFTFDGGGSAVVIASCSVKGPVSALAGTLVKIVTPTSGWTAVTNSADATPGTSEETDTALRTRQQYSTSTAGFRQIDSIVSGLLNLADVLFVTVLENNTLITDANGIPGKSIAAVVLGGDDTAIAEELFSKTPIGIRYLGTTDVVVTDSQGLEYQISFNRPVAVPITIDVTVTVIDTALWPVDGADLIKQAILSYAQFGVATTGFAPGDDIIRTRLYTPVNTVQGHQVDALQISRDGGPVLNQNITIDWNEIASFDSSFITVTVA